MTLRYALEIMDRTLRDIVILMIYLFREKIVVIDSDFRQLLSI